MNMYVGNLNFEVSESDLKEVLEGFGDISSIKIITDRESGRSKGFGFIEMDNTNEAGEAIRSLNGKMLMGRPMVMKEALPRN